MSTRTIAGAGRRSPASTGASVIGPGAATGASSTSSTSGTSSARRPSGARGRRRPWGRLVALVVLAAVVALPVYVSVLGAATTNGSLTRTGLLPDLGELTADNFRVALAAAGLAHGYLVSVAVVALQTAAQVATAALAAYALVFCRWRGRSLAFTLVLATMAVPGEALVIPNYATVTVLGLRDTVLGVALPYLAAGYPIFLLRQAFAAVPTEVWEAARLDGAGHLRTLAAVVAPSVRPQVSAATIWAALSAWNGFFWPLLITDTAGSRTVQVAVSQLAASEASTPAVLFAGAVLVVAPTAVLVIAAQRYLVTGLATRALH